VIIPHYIPSLIHDVSYPAPELCVILGEGVNQAVDLASGATSIPSQNLTPSMTFGPNTIWSANS
jgi:hypothetical protein